MKHSHISTFLIACLMAVSLSSCSLAADIFKAGAWTAIIAVVLVVGLVLWLISKMFR